MISLLELEKQLDLSEYERNLGNKQTRAGKFFWLTVLILYDEKLNQKKAFDEESWHIVCREYVNVFYKPLELSIGILDHYDGMATSKLKALPIHESVKIFKRQLWIQQLELEKSIRSLLKKNEVDFSELDPIEIDFFTIDFLDNRHPHLPIISDSYKSILDAANYLDIQDGKLLAHQDSLKLLKPSKVKHFNKVMDKITQCRYMIESADFLYDRLKRSSETFHVRYKMDGPQAALDHFIVHNPKLASLPDKQLQYHILEQYRDLDGKEFNNDSLRNVINKFRDE